MNPKYRFFLSVGGGSWTAANPIWKDDLALEYKREQGQMFQRASLSASLDFIRDDYDTIMSAAFGTALYLKIDISGDDGATWQEYNVSRFYITDCTVNMDDERITVKPETYDRYNFILEGLENEYDLIKLTPAMKQVQMQRRPLFQLYNKGDGIISNFLGGMYWESDVVITDATDDELIDTYHFGLVGAFTQVSFGTNPPAGLTHPMTGTINHGSATGEWADLSNSDGVYYMTYYQSVEDLGFANRCINGLSVRRISDGVEVWSWNQRHVVGEDEVIFLKIPSEFTMVAQVSGFYNITAYGDEAIIYGRWLLAKKFQNALDLPTDDIVGTNRNYRYVYPYATGAYGGIKMTDRVSVAPTEWGVRSDGKYYMKPELTPDEQYVIDAQFPVARSTWNVASIWLQWSNGFSLTESQYRTPTTLRNAYTLEDVIVALLGEIDSRIHFEATAAYSEFLYGTNPLSNDWGRLFMTPKSNVMVAEYTQPAQKAPVTLKDVFDMLRKTCGLYWFIDLQNGQYMLRIEHISWFKNGGSYTAGGQTVGIDLTTMTNQRNGKKWSYGTSEYKYDKVEMAERYQFEWMDDTTSEFKGDAIEVISSYVDKGQVEEETISMFNSDVDYVMLTPNNVSADGFVLMCAQQVAGVWTLPFHQYLLGDNTMVELQNYMLSMVFLQPAFLISDMPAWSIKVNGSQTTAKGIQRKKTQQVNVPCGNTDPDTSHLVKTGIGNGEIKQMSVRLTTRMAKMTLIYDTEQQQS